MSRPYTLLSDTVLSMRPVRRVIARDDALAIGHTLLDLVGDMSFGVSIEHSVRAVTKVANSAVYNAEDGDYVRITFHSQFGTRLPVEIATNQLTEANFRRIVAQVKAMAPPPSLPVMNAAIDYSDTEPFSYGPRPTPPVALWYDATVQSMDSARAEVLPRIVARVHETDLIGAATVGLMARSVLYLYKHGLTSFAEETDSEVTVSARTRDGTAAGWSGAANRDWAKITSDNVVSRAVELANRSRNRVAVEPGRRTAILGPAAVAQLVAEMHYAFNWLYTDVQGRSGTPFTFMNRDPLGRHTRFGMRVFDPRIMMVSDPADPLGGFAPFFEERGIELDIHGFPTPAVTWIDRGVLKHFAYRVPEGLERQMSPCDEPRSVHLFAAPETTTATIDEMIANCADGIYVNRFTDVSLIDRPSGMMTGATRDGCFLIRDGRISKPIKNFRFLDSPFFALNKLEMIGTAERVAFGYSAPSDNWIRWPKLPVIVPPLMVRDFNFSAASDAV